MVEADDRRDCLETGYLRDELGAPRGVEFDHLALLGAERRRLPQDLAGHADLADVVQPRGELELEEVERAHSEPLPDAAGEPHHGLGVLGGVPVPDPSAVSSART